MYIYVYISKVMAVTFLGSRVTEAQGADIKRCVGHEVVTMGDMVREGLLRFSKTWVLASAR